ncbi:MAG TPA: hypothetical protein VGG48_16105 [Rhizomicrobium sp.]|jgi:hypothetical protein
MQIKFAPASTIDQVNQIVSQNEQITGPITAMGNDGTNSTFDFDATVSTLPVKIAIIVPNTSPAPASSTSVCTGTIFIAGVLTPCTAYRPN